MNYKYKPEYEIGPKSPGVWRRVRELEGMLEASDLQAQSDADTIVKLRDRLHGAGINPDTGKFYIVESSDE